MPYYSGSIDNIKILIRQVVIGSSRDAELTIATVQQFQGEVDSLINSRLSPLFTCPLIQITRDSVTKFPDPIPSIASRWTAAEIVLRAYTEVSPQESAAAQVWRERALAELDEFCNGVVTGTRDLEGQIRRSRNHFAPPTMVPKVEPLPRTVT